MPPKTSTPNRGPAILLGILITMLCLSLGAIALIVVFNANRPTTEQLTAACKDQVGGAISAEYKKVTDQCKIDAEEAQKNSENVVVPDVNHPGFRYPSSWTAVGSANPFPNIVYRIDLSRAFLQYCEGCDGPYVPIQMMTTAKAATPAFAKAATPKAYIESLYAADQDAKSVVITEEKVNSATVIRAKGQATGLYDYTFDRLYYFGAKFIVEVDGDQSPDYKAGWDKVLSTIDFTKIE